MIVWWFSYKLWRSGTHSIGCALNFCANIGQQLPDISHGDPFRVFALFWQSDCLCCDVMIHDMISWYYFMIWYDDMILWYDMLMWYRDMISWYDVMMSQYGPPFCQNYAKTRHGSPREISDQYWPTFTQNLDPHPMEWLPDLQNQCKHNKKTIAP